MSEQTHKPEETSAETAWVELSDALENAIDNYCRDAGRPDVAVIRRIVRTLVEALKSSGCSYRDIATGMEGEFNRTHNEADDEEAGEDEDENGREQDAAPEGT